MNRNGLLAELKGISRLSEKVQVFFPSTDGIDSASDAVKLSAVKDAVTSELARFFGGVTEFPAIGKWLSTELGGKIVGENIAVLESYTDKNTLKNQLKSLLSTVDYIKTQLHQESVAFSINNELYFK